MKKGIEYLRECKGRGYASIFEVIYSVATEYGGWTSGPRKSASSNLGWQEAVYTLLQLCHGQEISGCHRIEQRQHREPAEKFSGTYKQINTYTITTVLMPVDEGPIKCLSEVRNNRETLNDLRKFRSIHGVPVCGLEDLDTLCFTEPELRFLCSGLEGELISAFASAKDEIFEEKVKSLSQRINELENSVAEYSDELKVASEKTMGTIGRVILACARKILGDKVDCKSNLEIANELLPQISNAAGRQPCNAKSMAKYIEYGRSREDIA